MDRTAWIAAFVEQLQKMRPHLQPEFSTSKAAQAIAFNEYDGKTNPQAAARRYHAKRPPTKSR